MVTINSLFKKYQQKGGRTFNKQQRVEGTPNGDAKQKRDSYVFYAGKLAAYQEIIKDLYELDKTQGRNQVIDDVLKR